MGGDLQLMYIIIELDTLFYSKLVADPHVVRDNFIDKILF